MLTSIIADWLNVNLVLSDNDRTDQNMYTYTHLANDEQERKEELKTFDNKLLDERLLLAPMMTMNGRRQTKKKQKENKCDVVLVSTRFYHDESPLKNI